VTPPSRASDSASSTSSSSTSRAIERLRAALPEAIRADHEELGDATVEIAAERLVEVAGFLRDDPVLDFDMLIDLTAVDHLGRRDGERETRFDVVYHLYSISKNHRLRLKVGVSQQACEVDSVVAVWPAANWLEREVYDLYGIVFRDHPDLRRILLYEEFEGHPLRKDYPKTRRQPLIGPQN
jgi:NADH-quinone oxidoreductase subunit C